MDTHPSDVSLRAPACALALSSHLFHLCQVLANVLDRVRERLQVVRERAAVVHVVPHVRVVHHVRRHSRLRISKQRDRRGAACANLRVRAKGHRDSSFCLVARDRRV
jgi:hypothetical protein